MESPQNGHVEGEQDEQVKTPEEYNLMVEQLTDSIKELKIGYYPPKQNPVYPSEWFSKRDFISLSKMLNDTRKAYGKIYKKNHKTKKRTTKKFSGFGRLVVIDKELANLIGLPKANNGITTMSLVTKILNNIILKENLQIKGKRTHFKPTSKIEKVFNLRPFDTYTKKIKGVQTTIVYNSKQIAFTELQKLTYKWAQRTVKVQEKVYSITKKFGKNVEIIETTNVVVKNVTKQKVKTRETPLVVPNEKDVEPTVIDWIEKRLLTETKLNELLKERSKLQVLVDKQETKFAKITVEKDKALLKDYIGGLKSKIIDLEDRIDE